jgi:phosphoglycerate dehydrogenase-like enzyme
LEKALRKRKIAGAAFDVHYDEPPLPGDPLFSFSNFLFTPHIGGASVEVIARGSRMVIDDLLRIINGDRPYAAAVYSKNAKFYSGGR